MFFANGFTKATELERYFSCPFLHFVEYGLKLKDKEIEVISSYFGLGREKITINQIAKNMNLSKQRVCVIKQKALNKLWLYIRKERRK